MTKRTVDEGIHALTGVLRQIEGCRSRRGRWTRAFTAWRERSPNLYSMRLAGCFSDAPVLTGTLKKLEGCRSSRGQWTRACMC